MPVLSKHFTEKTLSNISTPGRYWDPLSPCGLFLKVKDLKTPPAGRVSRTWGQKLRIVGRRNPTELGLGRLSHVSIKAAREQAVANARLAAEGIDPRTQKPEFKTRALAYIAKKTCGDRRKKLLTNAFHNHIFPHIGHIPADKIWHNDLKFLFDLHRTRPALAPDLLTQLEKIFAGCIFDGLIEEGRNPVNDTFTSQIPPSTHRVQHHPALHENDLPELISLIDTRTNINLASRSALKTIFLTTLRIESVLEAEWTELQCADIPAGMDWDDEKVPWRLIDWDVPHDTSTTFVWFVPEDHMKQRRAFNAPISRQQLAIFKEMWTFRNHHNFNHNFIFPSLTGKPQPVNGHSLRRLLRSFGFSSDRPGKNPTVHGSRTTFRNFSEKRKVPPRISEAALSHEVGDKTEASYLRWDMLEPRSRLMQFYADYAYGTLPADWIWIEPEVQAQIDEAERRAEKAERELAILRAESAQMKSNLDDMKGMLSDLMSRLPAAQIS